MLCIRVLFHLSPYKDFKHFRSYGGEEKFRHCFAELPGTSRLVALMPRLLLPFWLRLYLLPWPEYRNLLCRQQQAGGLMKNLLPLLDKLPPKRSIIKTLFAKLKWGMGLEHSRHRSPVDAFVHIPPCLAAYSLGQAQPSMGTVGVPNLS